MFSNLVRFTSLRHAAIAFLFLLGIHSGNVLVAHAQRPLTAPRTDPRIPAPSDTGRAVTGYQTYVRYDAPSQCANATGFLTSDLRAWSGLWHDTLAYDAQLQEHLPPAVIAEARRCAGHFTAAMVAPRELSFLLPLAVVTGDSVQARAVINRQLALASGEAGKAAVLLAAMQVYLQTRPVHLASAAAVLARFDTVAPTRRLECVQGHAQLLEIARSLFDRDWMRREIATMRSLMQSLSVAERGNLYDFYTAAQILWLWEHGEDSAAKALTALFKELPHPFSESVVQQAGEAGLVGLGQAYVVPVGQRAPPLPATLWTPSSGAVSYPKFGQMTLVVRLGKRLIGGTGQPVTTTVYGQLRELRAMVTRLHEKYDAHGLQVVFVLQSAGFTPPTSQADRFELTAKWFVAQFPFPVIVGQQIAPFTTLPLPDGRRVYGKDAIESDSVYSSLTNFEYKLIGKKGKFAWNQVKSLPRNEAELDAFIRQGVGLPAKADSTPG